MCFEVKQGVCFALQTQCNTCGLQLLYSNYFCPTGQYFQSSQFQIPAPVCLLTLRVLTARHCAIPATRPAPSETAATATINATAAAADIRAKDIFWMEIWPGESTWTVMSFCCQQTIDDRTAACLSWAGLPLSSTLHGWAQNGILRFGPTTLITQWA